MPRWATWSRTIGGGTCTTPSRDPIGSEIRMPFITWYVKYYRFVSQCFHDIVICVAVSWMKIIILRGTQKGALLNHPCQISRLAKLRLLSSNLRTLACRSREPRKERFTNAPSEVNPTSLAREARPIVAAVLLTEQDIRSCTLCTARVWGKRDV